MLEYNVKYSIFNNLLKRRIINPINIQVANFDKFLDKDADDKSKITDVLEAYDKYKD